MGDAREDTSRPGLIARAGKGLGKVVLGISFGVFLLLAGFFVLVWGEARVNIATAIERADDLNEDEVSDGAVVTYRGALAFGEPARDPLLEGEYAYIDRKVETCAWIEKDKKAKDGSTQKVYEMAWVAVVPDSASFATRGYDNKVAAVANETTVAREVAVGKYRVPTVTDFFGGTDVAPEPSQVAQARFVDQEWAYLGSEKHCRSEGGASASIGDQRLRFRVLRKGDLVTVFGKKEGEAVTPFRGQVLLTLGSRDDLVERMKTARSSKTWMFRAAGGVVLWIGLYLILAPALALVTWIPLVGGIVKGAATVLTMATAFGLTGGFVFLGWGMSFFTNLFGSLVG